MKFSSTLTASALVAVSTAQSSVTCVTGAHIIVARASGEDPGYGRLAPLKDDIISMIPGSDSVAVPYPATISEPVIYFVSEPEGVGNMTDLIEAYGNACPDRKMVLLGYSQGAQVVGDVLLGNVNSAFNETPGIDQKYLDQVAAVVMMGDPANVAGQSFLVGNSSNNGTFPRTNYDLWAARGLLNRTVSYCDANDTYCDGGQGNYSHEVHGRYVRRYGAQAAQFVVEKFLYYNSTNITATTGGTNATTTTTSGSSSATTGPSRTSAGSATTTGAGSAATTSAPPNSASGMYIPSSCVLVAVMALAMVL